MQLWSRSASFAYDDCYRLEKDVRTDSEDEGMMFGTCLGVAGAMTAEQWHLDCLVRDGTIRNAVELVGRREWSVCLWDVDTITGWEMLRLFEVGLKRFREERNA